MDAPQLIYRTFLRHNGTRVVTLLSRLSFRVRRPAHKRSNWIYRNRRPPPGGRGIYGVRLKTRPARIWVENRRPSALGSRNVISSNNEILPNTFLTSESLFRYNRPFIRATIKTTRDKKRTDNPPPNLSTLLSSKSVELFSRLPRAKISFFTFLSIYIYMSRVRLCLCNPLKNSSR